MAGWTVIGAADSAARGAPLPRHRVHFYGDDAFPDVAIADFLFSGLADGDGLVLLATPEHVDALRRRLATRGAPVEALEAAGRLHVHGASAVLEACSRDGAPVPARFATVLADIIDEAARGSSSGGVRAYGEVVALLADQRNVPAALAVERMWNELLETRRCSLACGYPVRPFLDPSLGALFLRTGEEHDEVTLSSGASSTPHERCVAVLLDQLSTLHDEIGERHRAEASLREALRDRESRERLKDEFLAMLGHELRNPLAPMVTAIELLERRRDDGIRREVAVLRRQAAHLQHLVDDLLDVARIARGKIALRREPVEASAVVAAAIEVVHPLLERRAQGLDVAVPGAGLAVLGDRERLAQLFANLLGNASKFTGAGGRLAIAARRVGDEIVIEVSDSGRGIRADMLEHIFEAFVQEEEPDGGLDRGDGGLGLGLALAKQIAELHGGAIAAASEGPGKGSTFAVRLPVTAVAARPPAPDAASRAEPRKARVLVVDDNHDAGEMLGEALRQVGYEVIEAGDGPEALRLASEAPVDAAVLDIGLPGMNGYELARRLRESCAERHLRLVALTGYGQEKDRRCSEQAGIDVHLTKPAELDSILRALAA